MKTNNNTNNNDRNQLLVLSDAANTCSRPCAVVEDGKIVYHNRAFKKVFGTTINTTISNLSIDWDYEILNISSRTYGGFFED